MTSSDKRAKLLQEIADGVDLGDQATLTPLVHKALRLAALLRMRPYEVCFQTHLDGPPKKSAFADPSVQPQVPTDESRVLEGVRLAVIKDREFQGQVNAHPLEMLEVVYRQAVQDRLDQVHVGQTFELPVRQVLSRIRNRLGRFVIDAEKALQAEFAREAEAPNAEKPKPTGSPMTVLSDASLLMRMLAEFEQMPNDPKRGRYNLTQHGVAATLKDQWNTEMSPERLNDAVNALEGSGYVKVDRGPGTTPYRFSGVQITTAGRLEFEKQMERMQAAAKRTEAVPRVGTKICFGHGGSPVWKEVRDYVRDRLELPWDEFKREATAGFTTKERLEQMLNDAAFAFLVMTAEDELADGTKVARANVIHEIGLFQGRLGFQRAIVLLEYGCEEFSNIVGITQIRFAKDNVKATFDEIRQTLEREGIVGK